MCGNLLPGRHRLTLYWSLRQTFNCDLMERCSSQPRQDLLGPLLADSPLLRGAACTLSLALPQVIWLASEPQGADCRASVQRAASQFKAWQPCRLLALKDCFLSPRPEATVAARTGSQAKGQAELPARSWWAVVVMEWYRGTSEPRDFQT